jgi:phosphonate transport system ATP-binding protein
MLVVRDLSRDFDGCRALDNVSFSADQGEFLGILGSSGAGKTTLLRVISRAISPSSGSVTFGLQDVSRVKGKALRRWRAKCAVIHQGGSLIERYDVLTNVLMGRLFEAGHVRSLIGCFRTEDKRLAHSALERLGIGDLSHRSASTLSGGQRQRVAVARALVQQADVLLADEPTASLDPANATSVMEMFRGLSADGLLVIIAQHDNALSTAYCDRIIGLSLGKVILQVERRALSERDLKKLYCNSGSETGGY